MFPMAHYEIEVKTLLGEKANAGALKARMREIDPETKEISQNKQTNH